jgi:hypothetical protein
MLGSTDENEPLQVILAFTTLTPLPVVILETHAHTKMKYPDKRFSDVFSKTNLIVSSPCHIPPLLYVFFFPAKYSKYPVLCRIKLDYGTLE